jgi:S-DNA-T family DNA segregation ATPase FtsK/SpoIIIE
MPTQIDSRTILDQGGAEKLLGHGDMLFMSGDSAGLKRVQGTYVSDKELKRVVNYLRELEWEDEYAQIEGSSEEKNNVLSSTNFDNDFDTDDDLYEDAKIIAREAGKVSASLLQRKLQVGYARAARLLDMMEQEGVIGSALSVCACSRIIFSLYCNPITRIFVFSPA